MAREDEGLKVLLVFGGIWLLSKMNSSAQASIAPTVTGQTIGTVAGRTLQQLANAGRTIPDPRVAQAQGWLNQILGSGISVDGLMGPQTIDALTIYQQVRGFQADGKLSDEVWSRLEQDALSGYTFADLVQLQQMANDQVPTPIDDSMAFPVG